MKNASGAYSSLKNPAGYVLISPIQVMISYTFYSDKSDTSILSS